MIGQRGKLTCFAIRYGGDCDAVGNGRVGQIKRKGVDQLGCEGAQPAPSSGWRR
jgi:hypothetical protein